MIESIPNPLNDKGVQNDINDLVSVLMERRENIKFCELDKYIKKAINDAARWGIATGFNMGWRVREVRGKL